MTTYTKSLITDFNGNLHPTQLAHEINEAGGISPTCIVVTNIGDIVEIIFDNSLNGSEEIELNSLIGTHLPKSIRSNYFIVYPKKDSINTLQYKVVGSFKYDSLKSLDGFELLSYKHNLLDSYSVRIVDKLNDNILVEKNGLVNDVLAIQDLGELSNIPTSDTILELQVKGVGSKKMEVYIEQLIVHIDN